MQRLTWSWKFSRFPNAATTDYFSMLQKLSHRFRIQTVRTLSELFIVRDVYSEIYVCFGQGRQARSIFRSKVPFHVVQENDSALLLPRPQSAGCGHYCCERPGPKLVRFHDPWSCFPQLFRLFLLPGKIRAISLDLLRSPVRFTLLVQSQEVRRCRESYRWLFCLQYEILTKIFQRPIYSDWLSMQKNVVSVGMFCAGGSMKNSSAVAFRNLVRSCVV